MASFESLPSAAQDWLRLKKIEPVVWDLLAQSDQQQILGEFAHSLVKAPLSVVEVRRLVFVDQSLNASF
jgi:hypothetical protein